MDRERQLAWPVARLTEAVESLARASRLGRSSSQGRARRVGRQTQRGPLNAGHEAATGSAEGSVDQVSHRLQFESDAGDVTYKDVERVLESAGPALLRMTTDAGDSFLAIVGASGRSVRLLAPDGGLMKASIDAVAQVVRGRVEAPLDAQVDRLLTDAAVPRARRSAARRALLGSRLADLVVARCWMLRPAPAAPLWEHMRHARLPRRLTVFLFAYAAATLASAGAWWLIGAAALEGRFDPGTLLAWSFLLLSLVPLGIFAMWSQGVLVVGVGGIFKLRLLAGALKLDPDDTRHEGIGTHFARVVESEAVEALALAGSFYGAAAAFDFILAGVILIVAGRGSILVLLVIFACGLVAAAIHYVRRRALWTTTRMGLTHDVIEKMVGHQTRLVQDLAVSRHDEEDEALERYVESSKQTDRSAMLLSAMPRLWLLAGIAGLASPFVNGTATPTQLAVGLGATLMAFNALNKITTSLSTLADAAIAWKQVTPLVEALHTRELRGYAGTVVEPIGHDRGMKPGALIAAQDLTFRFRDRAEPVLRGCSFRIAPRDRIHLSGPSGGGKSTLVSLLTGLRSSTSGLLLLGGLDRVTLGNRAWRRRVVAAPQFHENHLFNETLAFNLLMGRRWPPTAEDVQWAENVCRRLGLGDLLDRMQGGLFQVVGDTGWQLSHGERSRVFMARALLQGADLVVLDESFAELDPDSLRSCLPEVAELANGLLVVAHT